MCNVPGSSSGNYKTEGKIIDFDHWKISGYIWDWGLQFFCFDFDYFVFVFLGWKEMF